MIILNENELAALITGSRASFDNYSNLFFNRCSYSDIYNSDFDPDENLLSNSIMNIGSSYLNIDDSNLDSLFMNYFSVLNFNIQRFSSNFEKLSINFVDLNLCAIGFTETWLTEAT